VTATELAYRCGILAIAATSSALYLAAVPGPGVDPIRVMWQWQAAMATTAMQLATIAAGRAMPPPAAIEDARARDWLSGLCD